MQIFLFALGVYILKLDLLLYKILLAQEIPNYSLRKLHTSTMLNCFYNFHNITPLDESPVFISKILLVYSLKSY